jgi:hypothetical protein
VPVSREELARIKRDLAKNDERYSGEDLEGATIDCDYGLEDAGFGSARIPNTGDVAQMVIYACEPQWDAKSRAEVIARLEQSWLDRGAFEHEAHTITEEAERVLLDFATWWDRRTFYTGRIEVSLPIELQSTE